MPAGGGEFGRLDRGGDRVDPVDARTYGRGNRGRPGERDAGVVADETDLDHEVDEGWQIAGAARESHRGDPHGRTVGGAVSARLLERLAGEHRVDGALGRRPEQVERALRSHAVLPGDELAREGGGLDVAVPLDDEAGGEERLFGVVGDGGGGHPGGEGVVVGRGQEGRDGPVAGGDLLARHQLRGHAEGVANGESGERGERAVVLAHESESNSKCSRKWAGSR